MCLHVYTAFIEYRTTVRKLAGARGLRALLLSANAHAHTFTHVVVLAVAARFFYNKSQASAVPDISIVWFAQPCTPCESVRREQYLQFCTRR